MIKPSDITQIEATQISSDGDFQVIDVETSYIYENEKRTDKSDGIKYVCVIPSLRFAQIKIKVPTKAATITKEEIDKSIAARTPLLVVFEGFKGKFYWSSRINSYALSCTAESVTTL